MNPVIDNIKNRRSVRLFEHKPIPKNILEKIINAGNAAPSGMNTQNWRFAVVQNPSVRRKFAEVTLPKYREWLKNAPETVKNLRAEIDKKVEDPVYYSAAAVIFVIGRGMVKDLDCPMVCQNMMLAAHSLGVGSCWVYMGQLALTDPEVCSIIDVKEGESVYGPIIFGYPKNGQFPPAPPKKPADITWA